MKKKLIICAIIMASCISLLPFPQNIEQTFHGMNTSNGEKARIRMDMKYLHFLIFKDKIYGEITVTTEKESIVYGKHLSYTGLYPTNNEDKTMFAFNGVYLNGDTYMRDYGNGLLGTDIVGFEPIRVFLSRDFSKIVVYHSANGKTEKKATKQYIGNVEENKEEETLEYFIGFVE